ncbi:MAG TPA: phosphatase PAP2 family protein [Thermoanaerobaculia bacterium]|nr:phosphatase PAP2 family protein [Thermoanaerobaculia bacterium]
MLVLAAAVVVFFFLWGILIALEPLIRGSVGHVAHFTTKLRFGDYLPVVVLLIVGAAVAMFAGDQFIDLAELVHGKSPTLQTIDGRWHDWAVSERTPGDTTFFAAMSVVGGPVVMGVVTGLAIAWFVVKKRYRWAIYLAVTAGGGSLLLVELKNYFERARPALAEMLRRAQGYSFPSGHAMGATVVLGGLTYLAIRVLKTWKQKSAVIAFAATFVLCVASSRVYLGVHWLSDIAAGLSAGLLWVMTTTTAYEVSRRVRMIRAIRDKRPTTPASP